MSDSTTTTNFFMIHASPQEASAQENAKHEQLCVQPTI